jgi:hypothetical protein
MNRTVKGRAIACVLELCGSNETPAIKIQWRLDDGGRRTSTHWCTDEGMPWTLKSLQAAGFIGDDLTVLDGTTEAQLLRLLPEECELVIIDGESAANGKVYEEVQYVNKLGGSVLTAKHGMDCNAKLVVQDRFRRAMQAAKTPTVAKNTESEPWDGTGNDPDFDSI